MILHLNELEQILHIFVQPLKNKYKKRFPYGVLKKFQLLLTYKTVLRQKKANKQKPDHHSTLPPIETLIRIIKCSMNGELEVVIKGKLINIIILKNIVAIYLLFVFLIIFCIEAMYCYVART